MYLRMHVCNLYMNGVKHNNCEVVISLIGCVRCALVIINSGEAECVNNLQPFVLKVNSCPERRNVGEVRHTGEISICLWCIYFFRACCAVDGCHDSLFEI